MNDARRRASGRSGPAPTGTGRRRRLRRHPLRDRRRHRQDHDLPARGAQRLPAPDPLRAPGRVRAGPQRPRHRRDRAHRRGPRRVLLRRRPAHPRRRRLRRRRRHRPPQRARPPGPDPPLPKPVVAMVAGYAIGGGHVLHVVCDLTIAADNARFGQTGPTRRLVRRRLRLGPARAVVGQKKAREIWFLCRQYDAQQALDMGLVNTVVPLEELEEETVAWCREMLEHSPLALRMIKASCNAADDGLAGIQQLAGDATLLYYMSEEAQEGKQRVPREAQARLRPVPEAAVMPCSAPTALRLRLRSVRAAVLARLGSGSSAHDCHDDGVAVGAGGAAADVRRGGGAGARGHVGGGGRRRRRDLVAARGAALVVALALQVGRQLRQRLLRRCARHRQGAQGSGAPHRDRARDARRGASAAAFLSFGVAAVAGLVLSLVVNPWLLLVGVAAIAAAVALHRRTEAVRLPRPGRGHGARVLRVRRHGRLRVRAGGGRARRRRGGARSSSGCSRAPSSLANNVRDIPTDAVTGQAHARGAGRRADGAARCSSRATSGSFLAVVAIGITQPWALLGLLALPLAVAPVRIVLTRTDPPSLVAGAGGDVEARGRRRGAGERRAVPVLSEHRLRIGDRAVTLLEGPAGWGECSPLAGLPERSRGVPAGGRGGGDDGFPPAVRDHVPVNALVDGPVLGAGRSAASRR